MIVDTLQVVAPKLRESKPRVKKARIATPSLVLDDFNKARIEYEIAVEEFMRMTARAELIQEQLLKLGERVEETRATFRALRTTVANDEEDPFC